MRVCRVLLLALFLTSFYANGQDKCKNSSTELASLIKSHQERRSFDRSQYPLGLYTREHYKAEADYAKSQMQYFDCIIN